MSDYTPEQLRRIDGLVGEHVMGSPGLRVYPQYTTCWTHAGLVLEWIVNRRAITLSRWHDESMQGEGVLSEATSLPLVICLHALAVAGVDVAKEVGE